MKNFFTLVLLAICFFSLSAQAETITLVADEWCPVNCKPGSEKPGYMIEIAQKAFEKHGIKIDYSTLPWTRAIEETKKGNFNAIVGASKNDGKGFIFPGIHQGLARQGFYVKKGHTWKYEKPESLSTISLGTVSDYSYGDELDKYIEKNKDNPKLVQVVSGDNALSLNIKKLIAGRIDAFVEEKGVISHYLIENEKYKSEINEVGELKTSEQSMLYLAFSPNKPESKKYAAILEEEMQNMRKTGELNKIFAKYDLTDWQK